MATTHRLPIPGKDDGVWGEILNDFLSQAHTSDGSLAANTVSTAVLQDNSVTASKIVSPIPSSKLDSSVVTGSSVTKTANYTIVNTDHVVLVDATNGGFTVTLPTAVGYSGRYTIAAVSAGTNVVTVGTTNSQTIDGAPTTSLGTQASGATWSSIDVISDGSNWRTV